MVANRWGQIVFETTSDNISWDGNFKGQPMDQQVFNYYLKYICDNNKEVVKKGDFVLIR